MFFALLSTEVRIINNILLVKLFEKNVVMTCFFLFLFHTKLEDF